jgi:hypothetical protein
MGPKIKAEAIEVSVQKAEVSRYFQVTVSPALEPQFNALTYNGGGGFL